MSYNQGLIAELKMEAANTRKMLERVPVDKNDWKPHEKSMKLGNLANHVADLPGWISMTMTTDGLDLATMDYKPVIPTSTEELTGKLDENVNKALAALENASDADFDKMWTLRKGEHVMFTMPKKAGASFVCPQPPDTSPRTTERVSTPAERACTRHVRAKR